MTEKDKIQIAKLPGIELDVCPYCGNPPREDMVRYGRHKWNEYTARRDFSCGVRVNHSTHYISQEPSCEGPGACKNSDEYKAWLKKKEEEYLDAVALIDELDLSSATKEKMKKTLMKPRSLQSQAPF